VLFGFIAEFLLLLLLLPLNNFYSSTPKKLSPVNKIDWA
jgi:hypothetical protein